MDARDIKEIDSEQLELIRQMEQYLSCPCHLIRPADEDGDIMETYWEARAGASGRALCRFWCAVTTCCWRECWNRVTRTATERSFRPERWRSTAAIC